MGGKQPCGLHFGLANAALDALVAETAVIGPSCDEQPSEAAHLCELPISGRQLESAAQGGGSARVLAAAGLRIRVQLPTSCPDAARFRCVAFGLIPSGHKPRGGVPRRTVDTVDQLRTRCIMSCFTPIPPDRTSGARQLA